jgi:hypothetical protein
LSGKNGTATRRFIWKVPGKHLQYHVSRRIAVLMDDGSQAEFGPGEESLLPPGHDAWVVGNEPVVVVDITGMTEYARPHAH